MNTALLREALEHEITELFQTRRYSSVNGPVAPRVFQQYTPIKESGEIEDLLPYIIIRVNSGAVEGPMKPHLVNVTFLVGVYNDEDNNKGFDAVEEIINDIAFHFTQNPLFGGGYFRFQYPFEWANQEEESYPYFFGGATCNFEVTPPIYTKESVFA